jgi:hypothetical protein
MFSILVQYHIVYSLLSPSVFMSSIYSKNFCLPCSQFSDCFARPPCIWAFFQSNRLLCTTSLYINSLPIKWTIILAMALLDPSTRQFLSSWCCRLVLQACAGLPSAVTHQPRTRILKCLVSVIWWFKAVYSEGTRWGEGRVARKLNPVMKFWPEPE